jgi:16S rRNA (cytosine967-C5)-methyltransferase
VLRKVVALRCGRLPAQGRSSFTQGELPLEDGRTLSLREDVFSRPPLRRLAEQTSHPIELVASWARQYGEPSAFVISLHSLVAAPTLVTGLQDGATFGSLKPHAAAGFACFLGPHADLKRLLRTSPAARVQDPSSAAPVAATASLRPRCIIDFCSGQGTKTRQLAALHPAAAIIATDVHDGRRATLRESVRDLRQVRVAEPHELAGFRAQADLLLLDVPCSNTGVLARRIEAKYRYAPATMRELVALQRRIIDDAMPLLAATGHLLYATCSIDPAENALQADWAAQRHGLRLIDSRLQLPAGVPGDGHETYHDGGYYALFTPCADK